MVILGMRNSRMKDYFDVHALLSERVPNALQLADAISATFKRRRTALPEGLPQGLSDEFASDATKQAQWRGFLDANRIEAPALESVVADIRRFTAEPLTTARHR
jgi:hypothetical protein